MKKSVVVALHLGYWICYCILLAFIYSILRMAPGGGQNPALHFTKFIIAFLIVPGILGFYSFYGFLFDKYLNRKKILTLCLIGMGVSLVYAAIGGIMTLVLFGRNFLFDDGLLVSIPLTFIMSVIPIVNGVLGLGMKGFITWYGDIKLKEDLNKKNYEMELALVKNQINPHFLFNTINNIDIMISKDATQASAYLNKLSDIMRFMLYETKTEVIPLVKELTYIQKFIDLQKIRTSNTNYINYVVEGDAENLMIAPMLFIPFIENAFKHSENKKLDDAINIKLFIAKEKIIFVCENKFGEDLQYNSDQSGLGNELIEKRLTLLYPNKHFLEVSTLNKTYKVKLTITQ